MVSIFRCNFSISSYLSLSPIAPYLYLDNHTRPSDMMVKRCSTSVSLGSGIGPKPMLFDTSCSFCNSPLNLNCFL